MKSTPAGDGRAKDLVDSVNALWPGYVPSRDRSVAGEEYLLLPLAQRPTLMAPRRPRAATAAALRNYKVSGSRKTQTMLRTMGLASRLGLLDALSLRITLQPPTGSPGHSTGDSIQEHLRCVLDDKSLVVALHTSAPRANRKPVLQVVAPDGRTIAFVKVGTNDLTKSLVRAEAGALQRLRAMPFRKVLPPTLLHAGEWRGNEVLVQTAFLHPSDGSLSPSELAEAMVEIALIGNPEPGTAHGPPYADRLRDRVLGLPASSSAAALARSLSTLQDAGMLDRGVSLGHWHGDWTPWNMTMDNGRALVWDWERFQGCVPLGFDALHYDLQGAVVRQGLPPRQAATDMVDRAPDLLRPFGVRSEDAELTAVLYLAEIGTRYLHDRQEEAGSERGRLDDWLVPALESRVRRLADGLGR